MCTCLQVTNLTICLLHNKVTLGKPKIEYFPNSIPQYVQYISRVKNIVYAFFLLVKETYGAFRGILPHSCMLYVLMFLS